MGWLTDADVGSSLRSGIVTERVKVVVLLIPASRGEAAIPKRLKVMKMEQNPLNIKPSLVKREGLGAFNV